MPTKVEQEIGPVTLAVARWAADLTYSRIPKKVVEYAKVLLLDGIGCAVCGVRRDAGRHLYGFVTSSRSASQDASVWGRRKKVSSHLAALVNATAAHATNVGDTHRATILHTNYVTPQAAIAVAEPRKSSGKELITAIIAGNEIGARAGIAAHVGAEGGYFTPQGRGWHATGTMGALAAAVAAGRILRLTTSQMVQAIVMGGTQLTGMYRPCGAKMGKHWYAGKAGANGIEAAQLAQRGFIAGYRFFEDGLCFGTGIISPIYDLEAARRGLGSRWETLNVDMAIYPAKKTYYSNLDAVLHIVRTERLRSEEIERVVVRSAFATSHEFGAFRKPTNGTEAFNSLRHAIAAAVHEGEYTFRQLERRRFEDPSILAFSRDRIQIVRDRELEKLLPKKWPGAAEIYTCDGRHFSKRVEYHIGQVQNPLKRSDLHAKFRAMAAPLGERRTNRIIELVDKLESLADIRVLTRELRPS